MKMKYSKITIYSVLLVIGIGMVTYPIDLSSSRDTPASTENPGSKQDVSGFLLPGISPFPTPTKAVTPTPQPTVELTPTPTPTLAPEENTFLKTVPPEIEQLIEAYFNAILEDSFDGYRELVYNAEYIDEELEKRRVEYVVAYHNIRCYVKRGIGPVDYIVYALNDVEIATIDTYAPSMEQFFIKYDDDTNLKIYLAAAGFTQEEETYLKELNTSPDVLELADMVTEDLAAAMEKDMELKNFMEKLSGN